MVLVVPMFALNICRAVFALEIKSWYLYVPDTFGLLFLFILVLQNFSPRLKPQEIWANLTAPIKEFWHNFHNPTLALATLIWLAYLIIKTP